MLKLTAVCIVAFVATASAIDHEMCHNARKEFFDCKAQEIFSELGFQEGITPHTVFPAVMTCMEDNQCSLPERIVEKMERYLSGSSEMEEDMSASMSLPPNPVCRAQHKFEYVAEKFPELATCIEGQLGGLTPAEKMAECLADKNVEGDFDADCPDSSESEGSDDDDSSSHHKGKGKGGRSKGKGHHGPKDHGPNPLDMLKYVGKMDMDKILARICRGGNPEGAKQCIRDTVIDVDLNTLNVQDMKDTVCETHANSQCQESEEMLACKAAHEGMKRGMCECMKEFMQEVGPACSDVIDPSQLPPPRECDSDDRPPHPDMLDRLCSAESDRDFPFSGKGKGKGGPPGGRGGKGRGPF